jgi:DNA-binding helix-hairpin-helix protein with protein kinase domain
MQSYVIKNNQLSDKFQKVKQERMLIEQRLNNLNGAKKMCLDNLSKLKDREINHIQNKLNKLKNIEANIKNELQKKFNRIKLEFDRKLSNLKDISNNYKSSLNKQKIEIEELNYSLYGQQLNYFLDQYFIKKCNNISIGLARKSKLSSFGIETAADISYDKIIKIPTFGPHFTQRLVNWRKNLEKDFVFNPNQGVNPSDIALIKQRYLPVLRPLEKILLAGENELLQMRNNLHSEQEKSKFELEKIVYQVKQLENDLKIVNTS